MTIFTPSTEAEILNVVRWAAGEEQPLEIVGHASKRSVGRPMQTAHTLDLSGLSGVTLYEPEELVLSARAGTPLAEIEALLAERGQQLAFEPMDYRPLLGLRGPPASEAKLKGGTENSGPPASEAKLKGETEKSGPPASEAKLKGGTIGAVLAANLSGPRRIKAGAARDHILGVRFVSGRGELVKSGGRVVKNVTGYDLSKGMSGSWGTLGVLTEVTFKVLPAAEVETTLVLRGLSDEDAARAMSVAIGSAGDVSSAAHLPVMSAGKVLAGALGGEPATLLRLEGVAPSVKWRAAHLKDLLKKSVRMIDEIKEKESRRLWREIRDVIPFADGRSNPVWRVSMAPSQGWKMLDALRRHAAADAFYDWQGGLIWIWMAHEADAAALRTMISKFGGGHATLVRAPEAVRAAVPVFEPQPPALAALTRRLKNEFDPRGILNPGRMVPVLG